MRSILGADVPVRILKSDHAIVELLFEENTTTSSEQRVAKNLTLADAHELLDWLEVHGIRNVELSGEEGGLVSVKWSTEIA
jgi:hypothetical protein